MMQPTTFQKGERVGCHRGLYERPGYIVGPGEFPGQYRVRIVGLGTMDVGYMFLRRPEDMTVLEREWIDKVERANGP